MGRCTRVVDLLADYLERRLPPDEHQALEGHLVACPACVAYLNTYRCTVALLRSLRDDDLPDALRVTVRAFLDRRAS